MKSQLDALRPGRAGEEPQWLKDLNAQIAASGVKVNAGGILTILGLTAAAALVGAFYLSKCTTGTGWDFGKDENGLSILSSDGNKKLESEKETELDQNGKEKKAGTGTRAAAGEETESADYSDTYTEYTESPATETYEEEAVEEDTTETE